MKYHSKLASAAHRLTMRGVAVFSLVPGGKVPLAGSHGHLEVSPLHEVRQ